MKGLLLLVLMWPAVALGQNDLMTRYGAEAAACADDAGRDVLALRHCEGMVAEACMAGEPDGESNLGMSQCSYAEAEFWDARLNAAWRELIALVRHADAESRTYEPEFAVREDRLRAAERAWIAYRDAQCAFDYAIYGSGSMRQLMYPSCLSSMTFERVVDLISMAGDFE